MNCNNSIVRNCILDCLRYWVAEYHIDGFRFDLASILSRDENGAPMTSPPLLEMLAHDAVLGKSKLIAEAWDAGGMYQVGSFPSWGRWAEWNGKYRDCIRTFVKGDWDCAPELYLRLCGSKDMYGNRAADASVNFITCHDGFTLNDLVSYNEKHNMDNGEDNQDGGNDNNSWNCGEEGKTNDKAILALREKQMRNMLSILLISRGIPMILAGDEFANSQEGNNNAYCQDSSLSWLNWDKADSEKELLEFCKRMIAFRKEHPVLRNSSFDEAPNETGYPEVSFHSERAWDLDRSAPNLVFGVMFAESAKKYKTKNDNYIYMAVNAHWEDHSFELPVIPEGFSWYRIEDTASSRKRVNKVQDFLDVKARSIVILCTKRRHGQQ